MDRYKRLASNTVILAIGQFSSKFLVYIMMRFYTGMLGKDGYGAVANIVDASVLIMAFMTLSIGESIIRFGIDNKYDKSQVFSIGLLTTIIGVLFFATVAPAIGLINFLYEYVFLIYIYVFTGSIKSCCALFVRSAGYVRLFAIDGILTTAVNIIFNLIFMLVFNMGVTGYILSVVLADAFSIIFLFYTAKLHKYFRIFGLDKRLRRSMYRFCIPLIPTTAMWWITNVSDSFFITSMLGVDYNGMYKAAYRLPNAIALISGIFSQAWNMSAITEKNSRTIARFYSNVFNIFQSTVYVIAAGMLLFIKPLLDIMTANEFEGVYKYSPLLIISVVFTCFSTFMGSVYVASRKSVRSMVTVFSGASINIGLNLLLISFWGLQGAALATLVSFLVIFIIRAIDTRKIVLMDLKLPKMIINIIILVGMCLIVMLVENMMFYYISLSVLFLAVAILNFRSGIAAIELIRKKRE
ncbi:MAG: polysaccharide biosynthesis C-terminal domain-containing protein [Oscillospiraceae bacterium]|nr:polysaccharide biosynthesis C-terminal domain-containing protein [Oscillospiraceae bacterium]